MTKQGTILIVDDNKGVLAAIDMLVFVIRFIGLYADLRRKLFLPIPRYMLEFLAAVALTC